MPSQPQTHIKIQIYIVIRIHRYNYLLIYGGLAEEWESSIDQKCKDRELSVSYSCIIYAYTYVNDEIIGL